MNIWIKSYIDNIVSHCAQTFCTLWVLKSEGLWFKALWDVSNAFLSVKYCFFCMLEIYLFIYLFIYQQTFVTRHFMLTPQKRVQWMSSKNSSWNNKYCHWVEFNKTSILTNKKVLRFFLKVASDTVGSHRPGDSLCKWFQATGAQYAKLLF